MSLDPAGERDWLVPPENARRMYQKAQNPQKACWLRLAPDTTPPTKQRRSSINLKC